MLYTPNEPYTTLAKQNGKNYSATSGVYQNIYIYRKMFAYACDNCLAWLLTLFFSSFRSLSCSFCLYNIQQWNMLSLWPQKIITHFPNGQMQRLRKNVGRKIQQSKKKKNSKSENTLKSCDYSFKKVWISYEIGHIEGDTKLLDLKTSLSYIHGISFRFVFFFFFNRFMLKLDWSFWYEK